MMDVSMILAGFGGQGILSAGKIIATAALMDGLEVSWYPSYGPEMRGGTANCMVVISEDAIGSPVVNEADVLIALSAPSLDKFAQTVKPGGLIIIDSSLVDPEIGRSDVRLLPIPASGIGSEMGHMAFASIILLGCLARQTQSFSRETFQEALMSTLPKRHHHLIPLEMEAFDKGYHHEVNQAAGQPC